MRQNSNLVGLGLAVNMTNNQKGTTKMSEQEIFDYLKKNLEIKVTHNGMYYHRIKVELLLTNPKNNLKQVISSDQTEFKA